MVTRVDKKPIIYNTTLLRVWKPAVAKGRKNVLSLFMSKSVGHSIPTARASELMEDFEDIESAFRMFGVDDPLDEIYGLVSDRESDDCVRIARSMLDRHRSRLSLLRNENLMDEVCKAQFALLSDCERVYYGTEAVYQLWGKVLNDQVFDHNNTVKYTEWCKNTAQRVLTLQSPYMFIHPSATHDYALDLNHNWGYKVWGMWHKFKKLESMLMRIFSKKNLSAHNFHSGGRSGGFEPSKNRLDDFALPMTGYALVQDPVKVFYMMGVKYVQVGNDVMILSPDDVQNICMMAQAHFRTVMYFMESNKYHSSHTDKVIGLLKDMTNYCCRLIDLKKNFSNFIRSLHILAQKDFNDIWEMTYGNNLGWEERSNNYTNESRELDPMGDSFHTRIVDLAISDADRLNVSFFYHAFVGDEMLVEDLRGKIKNMPSKVLDADADTWSEFIRFCKAYLTCRYMHVYNRKPKVGGNVSELNEKWAAKCLSGGFAMPPRSDWGNVWIEGEFSWSCFADTWHLEAQDVAYVPKDSSGLVDGKYKASRNFGSELLMAMTSGEILDTITGSTAQSARNRIRKAAPISEVVLTTAPKAENAKPSWKKRVTFAADCEFRKMQSEYDRNCRKVMSFVRGPSLAVDQFLLESQFRNICDATVLGEAGAICSHDISAWSESMDRVRKFEFEEILVKMLSNPQMINIKHDWAKIKATVLKQGSKDIIALDNGSFQGFDGSTSTILHSLILIYCMETARRDIGMSRDVKTDMATLIDDCVALMKGMDKTPEAMKFWEHLKSTYRKLGFEVDELKSIFSTIKAIYLSRRFLRGAEVPSDMKVFIKAHSSYEDPLRCASDIIPDIFGATRGACDANGDVWFIYYTALVTALAELAHQVPKIITLDPSAAAVIAIAPSVENGWGVPSIVDWCTNDIMDKRTHFNSILEAAAYHDCAAPSFQQGYTLLNKAALRMVHALKCQPWRSVSYSNLFTNPFEAIREGPLKPDMLRRNAVSDLMQEVITAEPWVSLMKWSNSSTTTTVRRLLVDSGCLHAPTLSALVNCMPDNYRLGMIGKAVGSNSLLNTLPRGMKIVLKRRVARCAVNFFEYGVSLFASSHEFLSADEFVVMNHISRTVAERSEFYALNGVEMIDHTFPDPVASLTRAKDPTRSAIGPNLSGVRTWDQAIKEPIRMNEFVSNKHLYVPPRSGRVWEVTSEYARGWDTVSQRIAMGLAILARAAADGHGVDGLLIYFTKAWNESANITPQDTALIAIHGSMKRLDSNPGSSSHPITAHRNILSGLEVKLDSCMDALNTRAVELCGHPSHLHDVLAHKTAMRAVTVCILSLFVNMGIPDYTLRYEMALRPDCVVAVSNKVMTTNSVAFRIDMEILDGADNYGLLQAAPSLACAIVIPTMRTGWVEMINALISSDHSKCNELWAKARDVDPELLMEEMSKKDVYYSTNVVTAQEPAPRQRIEAGRRPKYAILAEKSSGRASGDAYTLSVRGIGSRFSRALSKDQPEHIIAAISIKSVVWDKLKQIDATELAKIYYEDPDAKHELLNHCTTMRFWKGVVGEVMRMKRSKDLSEVVVSGFRSLSIGDLRMNTTNDQTAVAQSVASFFGANVKKITKIVEHELLSVAGRSSWAYDAPIVERMITNNPALMNVKLRKEHMMKIIRHNITLLTDRIDQLSSATDAKEIAHRGDKRAFGDNKHSRLANLRNRRAVYNAVSLDNQGKAVVGIKKIVEYLISAAKSVAERHKYNVDLPEPDDIPDEEELTLEDCMDFSINFQEQADSECDRTQRAHGWDASSGNIGLRLAFDTIAFDSNITEKTNFAVSAAEIAPYIHKRIITVPAGEPIIPESEHHSVPVQVNKEAGDGPMSFADFLKSGFSFGAPSSKKLPIPAWQALFTLIATMRYSHLDVNAKLGTKLNLSYTVSHVRDLGLELLEDDYVYDLFPTLQADYFDNGVVFDPAWTEAEESSSYTVDEHAKGMHGGLF